MCDGHVVSILVHLSSPRLKGFFPLSYFHSRCLSHGLLCKTSVFFIICAYYPVRSVRGGPPKAFHGTGFQGRPVLAGNNPHQPTPHQSPQPSDPPPPISPFSLCKSLSRTLSPHIYSHEWSADGILGMYFKTALPATQTPASVVSGLTLGADSSQPITVKERLRWAGLGQAGPDRGHGSQRVLKESDLLTQLSLCPLIRLPVVAAFSHSFPFISVDLITHQVIMQQKKCLIYILQTAGGKMTYKTIHTCICKFHQSLRFYEIIIFYYKI